VSKAKSISTLLCAMRRVNIIKQGTTAKTVRWSHVLHLVSSVTILWLTFTGVKGEQGSTMPLKCLQIKYWWLESVLRASIENYIIIIRTFIVCASGVATCFQWHNRLSDHSIACTR
jgi:hypothetical protein